MSPMEATVLAQMCCPKTGWQAPEVSGVVLVSLPLLLDKWMAYKWIGMDKRREIFNLRIISQHFFLSPRNIAMNKQREL